MKLTIKCACGKEATFLSAEEAPAPATFRTGFKAERNGSKGWACPECTPTKMLWTVEGAITHVVKKHNRLTSIEERDAIEALLIYTHPPALRRSQ